MTILAAERPASAPSLFADAVDAWRGLTRRHAIAAALFALAAHILVSAAYWPSVVRSGKYGYITLGLLSVELFMFALMAAIVVADRRIDRGTSPWLAYAIALAAALATAGTINFLVRHYVFGEFATDAPAPRVPFALTSTIWRTLEWLMIGGVGVAIYAFRRRSLAMDAHLRAAESNRVAKSRQMLEGRLQAMQARVEPQFLFNTLAQVRELHRRDPARSLDMLDRLIEYLRAAMPHMRDTSSTVGQEITLAHAYLDIMRLRLGDRLHVEMHCPDELEAARMPPMMLLPLLDKALAGGSEQAPATISVAAGRDHTQLAISVRFNGTGQLRHDDAVGAMRERLAALYGDRATLTLSLRGADTTEARLDIPVEFAAMETHEEAPTA